MAPGDFDFVRELVYRRCRIVLEPGKEYLVDARLGGLARRQGHEDIAGLVAQVRAEGGELERQVVDLMTTNETSFFRDGHPFDALRGQVLPRLVDRNRATRRLRVWSAACSSGQEAYSLCMLVHEHFPELRGWDLRITGTDISERMLEKARRGRYSELEINRGLPARYMVKYFERSGIHWTVAPALRSMVEFRPMNLAEAWPPLGQFDLVLLRNVLIYFDHATRRDILERCHRVMGPGGLLLLGGAENLVGIDQPFRPMRLGRTTAYVHPGDSPWN